MLEDVKKIIYDINSDMEDINCINKDTNLLDHLDFFGFITGHCKDRRLILYRVFR